MGSGDGAAAGRLARRLRELREREWPGVNLTQAQLAHALSAQHKVASATLSSWENANGPKTPPSARLSAYARFFATQRSLGGPEPHLLKLSELDDAERERFEKLEAELFALHGAIEQGASGKPRELLSFDDAGPIVIICPETPEQGPLADEKNINYTRLHRYADADALIEVFGHVRALNPELHVLHRLPSDQCHVA